LPQVLFLKVELRPPEHPGKELQVVVLECCRKTCFCHVSLNPGLHVVQEQVNQLCIIQGPCCEGEGKLLGALLEGCREKHQHFATYPAV
jgi:hypothetical protein